MLTIPFVTKGISGEGLFRGYASVFHVVDHDGDILLPGSFQSSLEEGALHKKAPSMFWQHEPHLPIGTWMHVQEDDFGLSVEGQLNVDAAEGQHVYSLVKKGVIDGLSVGFRMKSFYYKNNYRYIQAAHLEEISLVTMGCNPYARITHIMSEQIQTHI